MASPLDDSEHSPHSSHIDLDTPNESDAGSDHPSDDGDTASQRSISLSSPPHSPRRLSALEISASSDFLVPDDDEPKEEPSFETPITLIRKGLSQRQSLTKGATLDTDASSEADADGDDRSFFTRHLDEGESPTSSIAPSLIEREKEAKAFRNPPPLPPRPPSVSSPGLRSRSDADSIVSSGSGSTSYSKKARPESLLVEPSKSPLVLGIALVDFNHLVGPKIEFSRGEIFDDEEISKILPFLALPDGAHLTTEDYSYFHLVPSSPNPSTIFGISCNRQIRSNELLSRDSEVTRSTVQKAVVVLASKPVFGPIRDRLGVVTRALFAQRDFRETTILDEFHSSLELSLRSQLTESGLYMGTSLRELVHNFRQRTLILLKALMLQKRIMFYGHPVERLCTYQYSLVTLVPGLLQHLDDCGSPPLAYRAQTLSRPNSLRTSDRKSMMAYMGLPLDLFGNDAFFQPYLPLQQLDMLRDTRSWLCGSTNSIVTQQKEVDLLVNIETGTVEFRDPKLERLAGLTPADRKWMDDIVRDVNETFVEDPSRPPAMQFKGSDDYLREKFEEYITGALASVKYAQFLAKGHGNGVVITDGNGDPRSLQDFNLLWIQEFKKTNTYEVWERVTDPMLFDIVEARHPCSEKPSVVADFGLRISEGISDLKLDQQLAPTREAISRTITAGSTNFLKAMEGVRGRWMQRNPSGTPAPSPSSSTVASSKSTNSIAEGENVQRETSRVRDSAPVPSTPPKPLVNGLRPLSMSMNRPPHSEPMKPVLGGWGTGLGTFFTQRAARMSTTGSTSRRSSIEVPARTASPAPSEKASIAPSVSEVVAGAALHDKENAGLAGEAHARSSEDGYGYAASESQQSVQSAGSIGMAL